MTRHQEKSPVQAETSTRHHAPSVGFMQPWRFIRVRKPELRADIHALVTQDALVTVLQAR